MKTNKTKRTKRINRSKRVAPGCKIDKRNIIKGTRRRKDFNYNVNSRDSITGIKVRAGKNKRTSKNTIELRLKASRK